MNLPEETKAFEPLRYHSSCIRFRVHHSAASSGPAGPLFRKSQMVASSAFRVSLPAASFNARSLITVILRRLLLSVPAARTRFRSKPAVRTHPAVPRRSSEMILRKVLSCLAPADSSLRHSFSGRFSSQPVLFYLLVCLKYSEKYSAGRNRYQVQSCTDRTNYLF